MPLSEITKARVDSLLKVFCSQRIPLHAKSQIKLCYEFRANTVTLFEDRPVWNDKSKWTHSPVAQFRFDKENLHWSLYCRDRNSKWHRFNPAPSTPSFESLVAEVDKDSTGIFWG